MLPLHHARAIVIQTVNIFLEIPLAKANICNTSSQNHFHPYSPTSIHRQ